MDASRWGRPIGHRNGLRRPPWGVPLSVVWHGRFSMSPASRKAATQDRTLPSALRRATACRRPRGGMGSQPPTRSPSITQERRGDRRATSRRAVCGLRPWRTPWEHGRKSAAQSGAKARRRACCTRRSALVGRPRGRSLPWRLGMDTRRTAGGLYVWSGHVLARGRRRSRSRSAAVRRSRPGVGLPWFCRLASQAWAHQASAVRGSQRSRKRLSWLGTASVGQGALSWATLCTGLLRGAASCCPVLVSWERLVCRPLRPVSDLPGLPGWSLLHRLLRVRGPCGGLGDLSAYPVEREPQQVPVWLIKPWRHPP